MIKNTKNICRVLFFSGVLLVTSACSDSFLQTDSPNQPSQTTYWQTESDALMALTACYDAMQSQNLYDDNIDGWKFGFLGRETSTDNGDHTWGDWMLGSSISKCASSTTDECFSMYWNANYEVIKRCNMLVENVERIPMEAEKIDAYKAEAIALRALMYCNLTSVFRDVPYLTKPLTLAEAQAPKAERSQIISSLLEDLKTWIPKIPVIGKAQKGRMSQEAGYAIMGRIALFNQRWDEAITAYKNVVGKVQLFKSGDGTDYAANYADLFKEQNETAAEVLLSVHFKGPGLGEGSCFGVCWSAPMNAIEGSMNLCDDFYCIDGLPIDKSPLFKGSLVQGAHTKANPDMGRYENRDPRMKQTFLMPGTDYISPQDGALTCPPQFTIRPETRTGYKLWKYMAETSVPSDKDVYDYHIIRYPEVLLILAEATYEKDGAISDDILNKTINVIRSRKGVEMPPLTNAFVKGNGLDMRMEIRRERTIELAFEGFRRDDLRRWKTAETELIGAIKGIKLKGSEYENLDVLNEGNPGLTDENGFLIVEPAENRNFVTPKHYYYSLPLDELYLNPNLAPNNPGW